MSVGSRRCSISSINVYEGVGFDWWVGGRVDPMQVMVMVKS